MNLSSNYWQEGFLKIMYATAYTFPEHPSDTQQLCVASFYEDLITSIPNSKQEQQHCQEYLEQHSIDTATENRQALLQWVNDFEHATSIQAQPLASRIAELDRFNPDIPQQAPELVAPPQANLAPPPQAKLPIPPSAPRIRASARTVAYGIRKRATKRR